MGVIIKFSTHKASYLFPLRGNLILGENNSYVLTTDICILVLHYMCVAKIYGQ
jgi:hypothetical protein